MKTDEPLIPLGNALEMLPRLQGKQISHSTVYRWARYGVATGDGDRIKLPSRCIGRRLFVTEQGLSRFLEKVDDASAPNDEVDSTSSARPPPRR